MLVVMRILSEFAVFKETCSDGSKRKAFEVGKNYTLN